MHILKQKLKLVLQQHFISLLMQFFSITVLVLALQFHQHQAGLVQDLRDQSNTIKSKLQSWQNAQALLKNYLPRYQALVKSGLMSSEPSELEQQLKHIQQSQQLYPVQYKINPARPYEMAFQGIRPTAMRLHLEMALLHEEDLLTLLNGLSASTSFVLQSCNISRLMASDADIQILIPQLRAQCELDSITLPLLTAIQHTP